MSLYNPANLLQKEPVVIAGAVRSVLWVLVLLSLIALDEKQLAGIAIGLEVVLGLFARQNSTSTTDPTLRAGTSVSVQGSQDRVIVQETPPGPEGIDTPFRHE